MTQRYIENIEEQNVNLSINGKGFLFHFFSFRDLTYVDISNLNSSIANGKRVIANKWLLPNYIAEGVGNIRFETYKSDGDDYVWYEGFNTKFRLVSYTDKEIKAMEEASEEE